MRRLAALGTIVWLGFATPGAAEVRVTMHDGLVSVQATNATVRQILAEWARVGHTTILNGDKVPGGPVSLQLVEVPESRALDVLLRSVSGYVVAPRRAANPTMSIFDRVLVMPASAAPAGPARPAAPPAAFQQPRFPPPGAQPQEEDQTSDGTAPRAPVFTPFPQQQGPTPSQPAPAADTTPPQPAPRSAAPAGVAVPGMVVQPPAAQPGQQPTPGHPAAR